MVRQVRKDKARRLFNNGVTIYVAPNKVNIHTMSMWFTPYKMNIDNSENFDTTINAYEYYNCNSELGNRCSFYVMT